MQHPGKPLICNTLEAIDTLPGLSAARRGKWKCPRRERIRFVLHYVRTDTASLGTPIELHNRAVTTGQRSQLKIVGRRATSTSIK